MRAVKKNSFFTACTGGRAWERGYLSRAETLDSTHVYVTTLQHLNIIPSTAQSSKLKEVDGVGLVDVCVCVCVWGGGGLPSPDTVIRVMINSQARSQARS